MKFRITLERGLIDPDNVLGHLKNQLDLEKDQEEDFSSYIFDDSNWKDAARQGKKLPDKTEIVYIREDNFRNFLGDIIEIITRLYGSINIKEE